MILKMLVVGPIQANCYIVGSEEKREGIVIDPGADAELILEEIEHLGLTITKIVNTHGHMDHIGAVAAVAKATRAPFAIHKDEVAVLQDRMHRLLDLHPSPPEPLVPDILLSGGDSIEVGELSFTVIHTPGHSPGGICLYRPGLLFSGDTLFNYGVGRADLPGGNWWQLLNSIHTKLLILPDDTIVYPGHGPETTIGQERRLNPFLQG